MSGGTGEGRFGLSGASRLPAGRRGGRRNKRFLSHRTARRGRSASRPLFRQPGGTNGNGDKTAIASELRGSLSGLDGHRQWEARAAISILNALLAGGGAIFGDSHWVRQTVRVESMMPGWREIARAPRIAILCSSRGLRPWRPSLGPSSARLWGGNPLAFLDPGSRSSRSARAPGGSTGRLPHGRP